MVVTDLQKVGIWEYTGFLEFLKVLDPKYTPPSRHTIMRENFPRLYQAKKDELLEKLARIRWCSITTNL
jgi:hypothetical protein